MKLISTLFVLLIIAVFGFGTFTVHAQTQATSGTMPILYNSSGSAVNTSGTYLPTGTYYLDTGGQHWVSYSDGVYYDPSTNTFGGSIYNPTGRAGTFSYSGPQSNTGSINNTTYSNVGVPNTGAGGDAEMTWVVLALAAIFGIAGAVYYVRTSDHYGRA